MISGIPTLQFVAAVIIGGAGIALIGCGVNDCWTRFDRKNSAAR